MKEVVRYEMLTMVLKKTTQILLKRCSAKMIRLY